MKKRLVFILTMAAIAGSNLAAQNSRIETINGKIATEREHSQNKVLTMPSGSNFIEGKAGDKENKTFEKKISDKATITVNPDNKQDLPVFVKQDGSDKIIVPDKTVRTVLPDYKQKRPEFKNPEILQPAMLNNDVKPQKREFKPSIVRKSTREDVATVTLKVVGNPIPPDWGDPGFHLILDADAEMIFQDVNAQIDFEYEKFVFDFYKNWSSYYAKCEFKIPENASPNLNNPNTLVDDEGSIYIPGGKYDLIICYPYHYEGDKRMSFCGFKINGEYRETYRYEFLSWVDDYEFKTGYEYVFIADYLDFINFYSDDDATIIEVIPPFKSTDLTNQEEVKVVVGNYGINDIIGDINLSYRVNKGNWTTPETFNVNIKPGEKTTCTFATKSDFSKIGFYEVEAKIDCPLDVNHFNDINKAITKKHLPATLPFKEDFDKQSEFLDNWTVLDRGPGKRIGDKWNYNWWNEDSNLGVGCLQIGCATSDFLKPGETYRPSESYLISDAVTITETGTYNISYWVRAFGESENIKILYGTTSDPDNMIELEDFSIPNTPSLYYIYAWYIPYWDINHKNFEINTPGNYYFAFCFNSYQPWGGQAVDFDNIRITEGQFAGVPLNLVNLTPVSSCDMNDGKIGALMYNIGIEPITEYTLSYKVNDGQLVTQTFTQPIGVREFVQVYFDQKYDFSTIGDYNINITTSTQIEENPFNYEKELSVTHYSPIKNLPFVSNFYNPADRKNWTSPELGGWWDVEWYEGYWANYEMSGAPLLSRCITLQPDFYRFKFEYIAGMGEDYAEDFYVTFGKSGTDPYQWKRVKEFINNNTYKDEQFFIEEEFCMIEITEPGEYEIAIFALRTFGVLTIFSATLENAPEHDFTIKSVDFYKSARLTPAYQFEGEIPLMIKIENSGKTANESGSLKLLHNNNEILSKDFTFTEIGQTKNFELIPIFGMLPAGQMNLKLNASLSSGTNKYWEQIAFVSDSTFAWDYIDDFTGSGGVGFEEPAGMGLIFELRKADVLTSINVGFVYNEELANKNFILAIYEIDNYGYLSVGKMIMEAQFKRTAGGNTSTTFDVPDIELQPNKKYFFEVRQLDEVNIEIAYDNSNGVVYLYWSDFDWFGGDASFGYIHVRPNFGVNSVGIDELRVENLELRIYPNPATSELRIENGELRMEKIVIYNAVGQVVMTVLDVNATSYRLDVEKLNSGLYFISVQTKEGVENLKFVVK